MTSGWKKIDLLERGKYENSARKKSPVLQQLFWECTLRCNLRCRHCGSDCQLNNMRVDMPLNDFLRMLDEIGTEINPREILVITTGGEPLMRKDIVDCGRAIKKRGFYWGMVTNGMLLTKNKLEELIDAGLDALSVSVDGLKDNHNWMRGNERSFDKAISAVKLVADNSKRLSYDVITCVNNRNLCELHSLRELLLSIGVKRWRIITVFPSGRAVNDKDLQLDSQQFKKVMDFIVETRKIGKIKASYGCEGFLGPYEYEVRDYQYFCQAGINVASILHDGSISGCLSIRSEFHQGNIYKDSFMDVWNNRFQKYRDRSWMRTGPCENCEVWRWCEGNGMHLRDNDGNLLLCNYNKLFRGFNN